MYLDEGSKDNVFPGDAAPEEEFRRKMDLQIGREKSGEKAWEVYGSGLKDYNMSFFDILHDMGVYGLDRFTERRTAEGKGTFAIDIMGNGTFLRELPHLEGGIAVTLVDTRDDTQKELDQQKNITVIAGDITSKDDQVWQRVQDALKASGREDADLITNRGVDGIKMLPDHFHDELVDKSVSLLSPDGLFVSQVKGDFKQKFPDWKKRVQSERRSTVNFRGGSSIIHHQHALATLGVKGVPASR